MKRGSLVVDFNADNRLERHTVVGRASEGELRKWVAEGASVF